jgi:hypothetical protein
VLSENLVRISAGSNAPNQDLTGDRNSGSS